MQMDGKKNFVFIVKTTSRTFYLVAKTEEEMQVWVHSISQVCNFSHLEDGAGKSRVGTPVNKRMVHDGLLVLESYCK